MTYSASFVQTAGSRLDYVFSWKDWLSKMGDTIDPASVEIVSTPSLDLTPILRDGEVLVWADNIPPGTYVIVNWITTTGGRKDYLAIKLRIE